MTLAPVAGDPGFWRDPTWDGTTAGTFAIIIGCSKYPYLKGGDNVGAARMDWMKEAQRLGQLYVSALTARKFFDWMSEEYILDGAPAVWCRMLLSPTQDELAADPRLGNHACDPTLGNCKNAISKWLGDIRAMPKAAREASRLLFFFSGHGLQSTIDQQILLPSDYLGDPLCSFDHALSTQNLLHGLKSIELPYRYYFLDACRNDAHEIRHMRPKGDPFLPVYPTSETYSKIETDAILYATTEAQQAWQPTNPDQGPTLFGQALLDGLRGTPNIEMKMEGTKSTVGFFALEEYMNGRIQELLDQHRSPNTQRVQPGGVTRPRAVAQLPVVIRELQDDTLIAPPLVAPPARPTMRAMGFDNLADVVEFQQFSTNRSFETMLDHGKPKRKPKRKPRGKRKDKPKAEQTSFDHSRDVPVTLQNDGWRTNSDVGHDLFGHETVTDIFSQTLQIAALDQRHWLGPDKVRLLRVDRTEIAANKDRPEQTRYRVLIGIDNHDAVGHWLQLSGREGGAAGVFLPMADVTNPSQTAQYLLRLEVTHQRGPQVYGARINRLTAAPMAVGDTPVAHAARLWLQYQSTSASTAVTEFEGSQLEGLLRDKMQSPVAAIIAALVLLRSDRFDLLHDWLSNVNDWFPQYPDGAVLWAEQVMRQEKDPALAVQKAAKALATLPERGLPMTSEGLSYAASLLDRLTPDRETMDAATRSGFDQAKALVEEGLVLFRPGGLFTSLANFWTTVPAPTPDTASPPITTMPDGIMIHGVRLTLKRPT